MEGWLLFVYRAAIVGVVALLATGLLVQGLRAPSIPSGLASATQGGASSKAKGQSAQGTTATASGTGSGTAASSGKKTASGSSSKSGSASSTTSGGSSSGSGGSSSGASTQTLKPGPLLSSEPYASAAYMIYPGTMSASSKRATDGFAFTFTSASGGQERYQVGIPGRTGSVASGLFPAKDKLYFVETRYGDDGPSFDSNGGDDGIILTDQQGRILQ